MFDPSSALYLAVQPREAVREGKAWLVDCFDEASVQIRLLNAVATVDAVQRHYEGGWAQFLVDADLCITQLPFTAIPEPFRFDDDSAQTI